jgi:hypothetical protein
LWRSSFLLYRYLLKRGVGAFTAVFMTVIATGIVAPLAGEAISSLHALTLATFIVLDEYNRKAKGRLWLLPVLSSSG